jgi:predicted phosphoadenosine phosphosulfate sulfurtransferase
MPGIRVPNGLDVFQSSYDRLVELYSKPEDEVVVSFSAGKDSMVVLEMAILAAQDADRLPVKVLMRDEEIMFPGTYEYAERVAARPEVDFHWIYAQQPVLNVFNRENPFIWVFDPLLDESEWVRRPPDIAYKIDELNINEMITKQRFPCEGDLWQVTGVRASESAARRYSVFSAKGWKTKPNRMGTRAARPIFDWKDSDVWKAVQDFKWDYNSAYDVLYRNGVKASGLRIAPPTMSAAGVGLLSIAIRAWPQWFDKVAKRAPGIRTAAKFGRRAVTPVRRTGESWEDTFQRECVSEAPAWIAERAVKISEALVRMHNRHSTEPFPETKNCRNCVGSMGAWRAVANAMYSGDPFSLKVGKLVPYMEPEFFREGSGTWGGSPTYG